MGNNCGIPKRKRFPEEPSELEQDSGHVQKTEEEVMAEFFGTELHFLPYNERKAQLEEWLRDVQQHNRERLRKEMITDLQTFVLNNVLLSVQFYANFDTAMSAAREWKKTTEDKMAEQLRPLSEDGMILGDRKCTLIHGMGQQLVENYIYRDDGYIHHSKYRISGGTDNRKRHVTIAAIPDKPVDDMDEPRSTFTCDTILPLEFVITWDNLEVYKESEWYDLKETDYAAPNGSTKVCRVCVEETDDKNKIPRGFVRIRVVDIPSSLRPPHPLPSVPGLRPVSPTGSLGYAGLSSIATEDTEFHESVHEVRTDSDLSSSTSESEGDFNTGTDFMTNLKNHIESTTRRRHTSHQEVVDQKKFPTQSLASEVSSKMKKSLEISRHNGGDKSGMKGYQSVVNQINQRHTPDKLHIVTQIRPGIKVSSPSSPNQDRKSLPTKVSTSRFESRDSLLKPSSALGIRRLSKSLTSLPLHDPLPPPSHHDPTSRSRSTSTSASDEVHLKWRSTELKRLWQFLPKTRSSSTDPMSASCFQTLQIELESDDELELASDLDSDTSDSDGSSSNSNAVNVQKPASEPAYEDRTYLNSIGFSADFCSEFKQVGGRLGIDEGPLRSAVILGASVRCAITQELDSSAKRIASASSGQQRKPRGLDPVSRLYTFTPSLQSKQWPQKPLIWWKSRMLRDAWEGTDKWPTLEQVELIEDSGCHLVPLGNRSVHSTQTENVQQTLVWTVTFPRAESILLDSLLHVQWRCLSFSALVFRAFIAPLGPLGVGVEHLRNILYFMCQEEFLSWNYEQPGVHLKGLLDRLYDCLGRGDMPSFFVVGHNLFKNIPAQNLRKVQAYLSRVRSNLSFHSIFMIRNLVQVSSNFYPMPKDRFKKLYDYMTVPENQILYLVNPLLAGLTTEDLKTDKDQKRKRKREQKEINQALLMNGDLIDSAYGNLKPKFRQVDHEQRKLRRKRERWVEKQEKIKAYEEAEAQRVADSSGKLPYEKRNSIDLTEKPVKQRQFSHQRLSLILKYFVKHFIKMAAKSYQFQAYAQASMYTQHVENLISLLTDLPNEAESSDTQKFKEDTKILRATIGIRMIDYIQDKISHVNSNSSGAGGTKAFEHIAGILTSPTTINRRPFSDNWDLRTFHTPPPSSSSQYESFTKVPLRHGGGALAKSLASLPTNRPDTDFRIPRVTSQHYRKTGTKWNSNPAFPPPPPAPTA